MTLIIGLAYKDNFVIASSDSRVTSQEHDAINFEKFGDPKKKEEKKLKVRYLTDTVLFAHGGISETAQVVERELLKRLNSHDSLNQCSITLKDVTEELWRKKKTYAEVGENYKDALSLNFIGTKYFGCYLIGFFDNGRTGITF